MAKTAKAVKTAKSAKTKKVGTSKLSPEQIANLEKDTTKDLAGKVAVAKKLSEDREVKYNYPVGCDTTGKRKTFRTNARASLKRLEKQILNIRKKRIEGDIKQARKELQIFATSTYVGDFQKEVIERNAPHKTSSEG